MGGGGVTMTTDDDDDDTTDDEGAKKGVRGEVAHERESWRGRGRLSKIKQEVKEQLEGEVGKVKREVEGQAQRERRPGLSGRWKGG